MPAVDIARLKIQAAVLVEKFDQPVVFVKELHQILDIYADRTLRVGIVAMPVSVLPAYRVPQSVLRQIEMEIGPLAATFPEQAMALTNALWKDGYLESRLLAAILLGRIHPGTAHLLERISNWVKHARDNQLQLALLSTSLVRIRRETPSKFLELMQEWFDPGTPKMWANAIHAIIPLLEDPSYENLPPVFNLLGPVIRNMPSVLQTELAELINALYAASAVETIYFLRQTVSASTSPHTPVALRRILKQLPISLQPVVLELVRQKTARV
ncbi:MAG: hypothetical protein NT121_05635 [Chloroflexi bacterium]|nr:hypothetical protein [Chloroflexota bacterium]